MKYLSPEMEIVEFDDSILTTGAGMASENMTPDEGDGWDFSGSSTTGI